MAWLVLVLMAAGGVWFAATYSVTMPLGDEWTWVPVIVGKEPISLSWLWSMHNEHRVFLPRVVYLALGSLSDFDFRAGAFFNLLVLSSLAAAMMLGSRRLRGASSAWDAFFPIVLLHWAQCENTLSGFQSQFVISVALAGIVLLAVARCEKQLGLRAAWLIAVCLVGLGLCGLNGLAYLPAMACWLAFSGVCRWRENAPHGRRDGLLLILLAGVPLALVAAYFVGFRRQLYHSPGVLAALTTSVQFLSGGVGSIAKETWPLSGALILAVLACSVWQLCRVFRARPEERVRAVGLICFLVGVGSLALAIGIGRANFGPRSGFQSRYMTLGAPLLCLFYLQFSVYGPAVENIRFRRILALLMCLSLAINTQKGICYAENSKSWAARLEDDIHHGLSAKDLAIRHGKPMRYLPTDVFAQHLELLRQARLGPYRHTANEAEINCSADRVQRTVR